MSYTDIFGGQNVNPSLLSLATYSISANLTLVWAFEAVDGDDVAAAKIDVTATVGSLSVTMPDAELVSDGQDILVTNRGSNTFTVKDAAGATLASVTSGTSWYIYLTDNATEAGTWFATQLGASTSAANASALAGKGLNANATKLDQIRLVVSTATALAIASTDLASVQKFTGGAETWTFPSAVTVANGWFVTIINEGTGVLTLDPSGTQTIDGALTKALNPQESVEVFSDGVNLVTFGFGRSVTTGVSTVAVDLTGSGTYTESTTEVAAQVQDFSGALSGNRTVYFGTTPGYWLVYNGTTGSYLVTFAVNGSDTGVAVQQGTYRIIRSNGANATFSSPNSGNQTFTATDTFTWPVCKGAKITILAPGGGGGRGIANGGSGGGGGGGARMDILISVPPAAGTTTAVTIGAAGVGATTTNTAGTAGGVTSFGSFGSVNGGLGGLADGLNNAVGGGSWGSSRYASAGTGIGGQASASTGSGQTAEWGGGGGGTGRNSGSGVGAPGACAQLGAGGGGGGGYNTPDAGGAGGSPGNISGTGGGGAGGTAGGATGGAGTAGSASTTGQAGTGGGGGGGGSTTGGAGGAGGAGGGGGGGGGFGVTTSGNGGNGGAGRVYVTWW